MAIKMTEPKSECCVYTWGNNSKRATMKGRRCRPISFGKMNSALVEFENGQKEIVSRRAYRHKPCKVKEERDE